MTFRNFSSQQGRLASLFFAVAVAGSLAACGGGGGGGAPAAAPAPAAPAPPAAAPTSQLVLTLATPSNANGTITTAGATFTRQAKPGSTSFSGGRPFCEIKVENASNGTTTFVIAVNFVQSNGEVLSVAIDDEKLSRGPNFGADLSAPAASVMNVDLPLKVINFNNTVMADPANTTTATVNGKIYYGVAGSTNVCE
jgi:hypothetical protein